MTYTFCYVPICYDEPLSEYFFEVQFEICKNCELYWTDTG